VSLQHGTRIGPYEVTAQIGEGGMGQVYRATDSNLARSVAIKVLPDAFAQDAERVARFEREARTLAALNHPNIAHVYGCERAQNQVALVMELVEGPTLDERITHGVIPLREALPLPGRSPTRWKTHTNSASCIAISSPPTSRFDRTAR
jgi:serine/threonine protein kinase